jgi:hypothetical protein
MNTRRATILVVLGLAALVPGTVREVHGQGKKSDAVVKASASADKPDADGKQVVTLTLTIDPKYHLYANPVGNADLESSQVLVKVGGKAKLDSVKINYPPGQVVKDKVVGDYKIYKDKAVIKATVKRAKGATGALEVSVTLVACSKTSCLLPATIKVEVP